jgi:hypothetical protein
MYYTSKAYFRGPGQNLSEGFLFLIRMAWSNTMGNSLDFVGTYD